jgi:hypothetical protein
MPPNHGQSGSTSGADSNDPTPIGPGLSYNGDDYDILPHPIVDFSKDWSIGFVVKRDGTPDAAEYWYSNGNASTTNQYSGIGKSTSNKAVLVLRDDSTTYQVSCSSLVTLPDGWNFVVGKKKGSVITLYNLTTNEQESAFFNYTQTLNVTTLGAMRRSDIQYYFNGTMAYGLIYNRYTTDNEDKQNYKAIRKELLKRGVILAA